MFKAHRQKLRLWKFARAGVLVVAFPGLLCSPKAEQFSKRTVAHVFFSSLFSGRTAHAYLLLHPEVRAKLSFFAFQTLAYRAYDPSCVARGPTRSVTLDSSDTTTYEGTFLVLCGKRRLSVAMGVVAQNGRTYVRAHHVRDATSKQDPKRAFTLTRTQKPSAVRLTKKLDRTLLQAKKGSPHERMLIRALTPGSRVPALARLAEQLKVGKWDALTPYLPQSNFRANLFKARFVGMKQIGRATFPAGDGAPFDSMVAYHMITTRMNGGKPYLRFAMVITLQKGAVKGIEFADFLYGKWDRYVILRARSLD